MRTKTVAGVALVTVVIAVAMFGAEKVIDSMRGLFVSGTEVIGEGSEAFMVASSAKSNVDQCTMRQMVGERRCKIPVLIIDAAKMPYISRNIKLAWEDEGHPGVLRREEDPIRQKANRNAACTRAAKAVLSGSCDEYPIASSKEGGAGARVEGVPMDEQCAQGWVVMETARVNNLRDNDPFAVVIINPAKIATDRYHGGMWLGAALNC